MIVKDNIKIGDEDFIKQYSDAEFYIERDGEQYSEAIDPADITREYTETDKPIEGETTDVITQQKSEAFDYLIGGDTSE